MTEFRDEVALAVLMEMWRNPISAARIIKEGKVRELSATDALAEAAYAMADAMMTQRPMDSPAPILGMEAGREVSLDTP